MEGCERCTSARKWIDGTLKELAVFPDGPTFLKRCTACGALWHENLRGTSVVSVDEAKKLYPDWRE